MPNAAPSCSRRVAVAPTPPPRARDGRRAERAGFDDGHAVRVSPARVVVQAASPRTSRSDAVRVEVLGDDSMLVAEHALPKPRPHESRVLAPRRRAQHRDQGRLAQRRRAPPANGRGLRKFSGSFSGESRRQHVEILRSGALGASAAADDRDAAETDSASARTSSRSGGSTTRGATAIPGGGSLGATKSQIHGKARALPRRIKTGSAQTARRALREHFRELNTRKFEYTKGAMRAFSSPSPSSFAVSSRVKLRGAEGGPGPGRRTSPRRGSRRG